MNNVEIYIVVEGQTEQTFIRDIFAPEMSPKGIFLHAALIGKPGHKGGHIHFDRLRYDIGRFLKQRCNTYVSTMIDYFRIDAAWPGLAQVRQQLKTGKPLDANEKALIVEEATLRKIEQTLNIARAGKRFIPYIMMHEFESLLFSDTEILAHKTGINLPDIDEIIRPFKNPEEINDDPEKAPSKQLIRLMKAYRKVAMGKTISAAIGIETIRRKCPHFHRWLEKLEKLVG